MFNLLESVIELEKIIKIWEDFKVVILAIGGTGVATVIANIFLKVLTAGKMKRLVVSLPNIVGGVTEIKKDVLELVGSVVETTKEINKKYNEIKKDIQDQKEDNVLSTKKMLELATITIALSTAPTALKQKALEILNEFNVEIKATNILDESIKISNESVTDETTEALNELL
jgi:hypothetical protein